jgi:hypothetical protein
MDAEYYYTNPYRRTVMNRTVFDPTVPPAPTSGAFCYAPRPSSLKGLRVGLVENTKFNSEVILRKIAERLATRYQVTLTHLDRKKSPGHSVTPAAITFFQQKADFVLAGVGD